MQIFTKKQQENIDEMLKNADHQTVCRILEAVLKIAFEKQNNINTKN